MSRNDPVELTVAVHGETEKGLYVSLDGDLRADGEPRHGVWLPKSKVTLGDAAEVKLARWQDRRAVSGTRAAGVIVIDLAVPEWLAHDKGLI